MAKIFIIGNCGRISTEYGAEVPALGHQVHSIPDLAGARAHPALQAADVVFMAARLPDATAVDGLRAIQEVRSRPDVVIVDSPGDPEEAERSINAGAWDYVDEPPSFAAFSLLVSRVLQNRFHRNRHRDMHHRFSYPGAITRSPAMEACLTLAAQAADSDASVLIIGETGVGKELLATAIHAGSPRAGGNFVVVDCAAIPPTLVESTLLGHGKGAFTGADRPHVGLVKQADGGTLFLDEVSEIPFDIQRAFLRALDERRFRPVGATEEISSDFRIIAASNRDLQAMAQQGEFRRDLLYRIRAFTIELPPLRERPEDIGELIRHYVPVLCARLGIPSKEISPAVLDLAASYGWPGNVRELINAVERSIVVARSEPVLFPTHLPTYIRAQTVRSLVSQKQTGQEAGSAPGFPPDEQLPEIAAIRDRAVAAAERTYLERLIHVTGGDVAAASRISGLSRSRLYALLKKHGLRLPPS